MLGGCGGGRLPEGGSVRRSVLFAHRHHGPARRQAEYAGWDSEFQYNLSKILGVTADVGGNYGRLQPNIANSHTYTLAFGPTFSLRTEHSTIFAHTLFGENTTNIITTGANSSDSAFAMVWGGGFDVKLSHTLALRLGQLDSGLNTPPQLHRDRSMLDHPRTTTVHRRGIVINLGSH